VKRYIVMFADADYLIGVVGVLESIRYHLGERPQCTVQVWYQERSAKKDPGKQEPKKLPNPSLFYSKVTRFGDVKEIIEEAYPFAHVIPIALVSHNSLPEHVFYLKSAVLRETVNTVGKPASILYMDTDCMVNGPLDQMWELIESGFFVFAPDPQTARVINLQKDWEKFAREPVLPRMYGCAGLLGFTTAYSNLIHKWEAVTAEISQMLIDNEYAESVRGPFGATDQDAINLVTTVASGPRSYRVVAPRDLVDFQRNFYEKGEPGTMVKGGPVRFERRAPWGNRTTRPAVVHCFDKWWKLRCVTPVRTLGYYYLNSSPLVSSFEYLGDPLSLGDGSARAGPRGDTNGRPKVLRESSQVSGAGMAGGDKGEAPGAG